jgi:hypothetical protein
LIVYINYIVDGRFRRDDLQIGFQEADPSV